MILQTPHWKLHPEYLEQSQFITIYYFQCRTKVILKSATPNFAAKHSKYSLYCISQRRKTVSKCCFCDAMHPGTCRHCKNDCVSRTTQKTWLSLSTQQKLRNLFFLPSTLLGHPHKKSWIFHLMFCGHTNQLKQCIKLIKGIFLSSSH